MFTTLHRCECGSCEVMPTEAECICCSETPAIDHIRDSFGIECITQHQTVIDNCLNIRVLEVSLYDYTQSYGPIDDNEPINEYIFSHLIMLTKERNKIVHFIETKLYSK